MAPVNQSVLGYPAPPGSKHSHKWDHYGPASYVQYSATTPAGDIVNASDMGFAGFDDVGVSWSGYSQDGSYIVQINPTMANDIPAGSVAKRFTVQWFTTAAAFGAKSTEVTASTPLGGEYVRLSAIVV